jgi:hypothetical protein
MKPKKFEQLLLVMKLLDDCDSLCLMMLDSSMQKKKHRKLREQMAGEIRQVLASARVEVLKI